MDAHGVELTQRFVNSTWAVGYGLVLTLLLARAVWLSDNGRHAQTVVIAKLVAVGALAPLGSWLAPTMGGPYVFISLLVALTVVSLAPSVFRGGKGQRVYSTTAKY